MKILRFYGKSLDISLVKIYLMRHGDAESGVNDEKRSLSAEGKLEAHRAGEFMRRVGEAPAVIYHSKLLRSLQTAMGVVSRLGLEKKLTERGGLLPNDSVSRFAEELMSEIDDVMIVGHQPFVSRLAALLTTGSPDGMFIKFPTGAIVCLERSGKGFSYTLRFHVTSKLLSRLIGD